MTIDEQIAVMQHFRDGGEIEAIGTIETDDYSDHWMEAKVPCWNFMDYRYRIKKPKQTITLETWLLKRIGDGMLEVVTVDDVDKMIMMGNNYPFYEKIKLLKTEEIEL